MNKFFAIFLLALVSQLHGMDSLYPHDYQCNWNKAELAHKRMLETENEFRAYSAFENGVAPLVIAHRRTLDQQQTQAKG